jgi:hypothetical protein
LIYTNCIQIVDTPYTLTTLSAKSRPHSAILHCSIMSKKKSSLARYVTYIQSASHTTKHFHAIVFSAFVTGVIVICVLYFEYGFWREKYYSVDGDMQVMTIEKETVSPLNMFKNFVSSFDKQIQLSKDGEGFLYNKETYSQKEAFLEEGKSEKSGEKKE